MLDATVYRWTGHNFEPFAPPTFEIAELLVAESWLVNDSMTIGWILHMQRFSRAVVDEYHAPLNLWELYTAVVDLIPQTGHAYPRLECSRFDTRIELILRIRSTPTPRRDIAVTIATSDERLYPQRKGPDLAYQMQLRRSAQMQGADEMLLLNEAGHIVNGALSNVVWWEDERLNIVPENPRKFTGITEQLIRAIADASGIGIDERWITPAALMQREAWLVSSTYGIRPITEWYLDDTPVTALQSSRARIWQRRLESLASSIRQ